MVNATSLLLCLLVAGHVQAQQRTDRETISRKGLLRAQGTISPAVMLHSGALNIYLHGDAEYHLSDRISVKGDGYYFLGTQGEDLLQQHHGIFFGAQYHFPLGNFVPFVGMQPGASYVETHETVQSFDEIEQSHGTSTGIVPLLSFTTGFNWYVWRFIHFTGQVRYVHGKHAMTTGKLPLDELRFAIGLGWNVNTINTGRKARR
jgi:hypothetical protein